MAQTMAKYPHVIDGGKGQRMTLLARRHEGSREWLEVESEIGPGAGPPLHRHQYQDESVTVIEGRLGYVIAEQEDRFADVGESVDFPRGVAHRFWNAGSGVLRCAGRISPPMQFEYFIAALYRSTVEHGGVRPGLFDLAFLLHHFKTENEMVGLPLPIRNGLLPVLRQIGRLTGRYEKYRDAPASGPA